MFDTAVELARELRFALGAPSHCTCSLGLLTAAVIVALTIGFWFGFLAGACLLSPRCRDFCGHLIRLILFIWTPAAVGTLDRSRDLARARLREYRSD